MKKHVAHIGSVHLTLFVLRDEFRFWTHHCWLVVLAYPAKEIGQWQGEPRIKEHFLHMSLKSQFVFQSYPPQRREKNSFNFPKHYVCIHYI